MLMKTPGVNHALLLQMSGAYLTCLIDVKYNQHSICYMQVAFTSNMVIHLYANTDCCCCYLACSVYNTIATHKKQLLKQFHRCISPMVCSVV